MKPIQLFVKFQDNIKLVCVNPFETIQSVKNKLHISCDLYHHKKLKNWQTVEHYGLQNNDTIQAFSKLQGGIPTAEVTGPMQYALAMQKFINELIDRKITMAKMNIDSSQSLLQRIGEKLMAIGQFVKGMITVAKFFPIITLVLMVLASLGRPMEFLAMIIGLIFVVVIYIIYSVLNLPPFIFVVCAIWFTIFNIIPFLIYTAVFLGIFLIISLVCILLTVINTVFWGSLKSIVLCQTKPSDWYATANFHLNNKWERALMCNRPCFSYYYPDTTGIMCQKVPKGYPPYCPQAEIMRIYSTRKSDRRYIFKNFDDKSNVKYLSKKPEERELDLKNYYLNKRLFRESCRGKMAKYDPLTLSICSSVDTMETFKHLQPKEINRLKQVCAEAFCGADRNYPFCSKMSGLKEDDANALIKKVIKIILIMIALCLVFYFAMENLYKKSVSE